MSGRRNEKGTGGRGKKVGGVQLESGGRRERWGWRLVGAPAVQSPPLLQWSCEREK